MLSEFIGSLKFLFLVGITYYVLVPLIILIFNYTIGKKFLSGRKEMKKSGNWAVITGATDGIGKAYANELAKDGFDIVLISRTLKKLQEVAHEIENSYSVSTKIISADFTQTNIYESISSSLKGLDIGVLVNNVGMSYPHPIYIYDNDVLPDNLLIDMVNCNCVSVVMMTRIVLPGMVARGKGGTIINVASYSGCSPLPFLSVYSATKAFVDFLSRAVQTEIGNRHNIEVQSVLPLFVATKMSRMRESFFTPSPEAYVKSALDLVMLESRTFGYFSHAIQAFFLGLLPEFVVDASKERTMKQTMNKAIRRKNKTN